MPSPEWIRNIATATFDGEEWHVENLDGTNIITRAAVELGREVQSTINTFNSHASIRIDLFPVKGATGSHIGFVLVRGGLQVRLTFDQDGSTPALNGVIIETKNFQVYERPFTRLTPVADTFGGIGWQAQQGPAWTTDQLIRKILIHLVESTHKIGASR